MYITYNYNGDSEWEGIQQRTLDPYALLKSDTLNKINSIYGDNLIISGFDLVSLQRSDYLRMILNPGKAIKDSVLIEITESIAMNLENYSEEFLDDFAGGKDQGLIVLTYKYDKVTPPPQAKIEFIKESEYDPEYNLALYRMVFAEDGSVETMTRVIEPKDNVIYEQMLTELQSVALSSVNTVLAELGNQGIADLIQSYMRIGGTSISGDWSNESKYYLIKTISKYNYRDLLEVRLAINVGQEYYYSKYIMHEVQSINSGIVWDVNYESLASVNTDLYAINKYATIVLYESENESEYNIYLRLDGNIRGRVEVLQTDVKSDLVEVLSISDSDGPNLARERFYWTTESLKTKETNLYLNGYMVWSQCNMGHTSGLDADLLDGHEADYFTTAETFENTVANLEQSIADLNDIVNVAASMAERVENLESYFDPLENTDNDKVVLQSEKSVPNGIPVLNEDGVVPEDQLDVKVVDGVLFHADDVDPVGKTRLNVEGTLCATRIYNAVYGDVAECFPCNTDMNAVNCANRIVVLDHNTGKVKLSDGFDRLIIGVVSDTYGVLMGAGQDDLVANAGVVPVAVAGTVWVKLEEMEENKNYLGCFVGPGDDGYGKIVTAGQPHVGMIVYFNEGDSLVKILVSIRH